MFTICVDDEEIILNLTLTMCRKNPSIDEVKGFTRAKEALKFLEDGNKVDLALLDIDMPEINGINLAAKIKTLQPDAAIIFVTGYAEYAVKAFEVHAQGYLLKPISEDKLKEEIDYAMASVQSNSDEEDVRGRDTGEFFTCEVQGTSGVSGRSSGGADHPCGRVFRDV